jgi:lipopolysaccharide export system permease protein
MVKSFFTLRIIDRYVLSELLGPFFIGILGFVMVMVTDLLFTYTDMIINRGVPLLAVLRLLLFKLPYILVMTFPVSVLFATAMALGRLSKDNEIIALRTSGINFFRLSAPIVIFSLVISLVSFFTNERLVPYANRVSDEIIRNIIYRNPLPQVKEDVFFKDAHNRYYYVNKVDTQNNKLYDILVYEFVRGETLPRIIFAASADYENLAWDLRSGRVNKFDAQGRLNYEATFDRMKIFVNEDLANFTAAQTPEQMNSAELKARLASSNRSGRAVLEMATDYYMKFSVPLTCFIFALVGIPLSLPAVRSGRTWGVTLSIVVMFTFYVFASVFRSLGRGGVLTPLLAAWLPQFLFGTFGLVLLLREGMKK